NDAGAIGPQALAGVDEAKLDGKPVQRGELDAVFLVRLEAELAVGLAEGGKIRVGQKRRVAENLVENIRLLQVVELVPGADEGGGRKFLVRQQIEKLAEGNQRRHRSHFPA